MDCWVLVTALLGLVSTSQALSQLYLERRAGSWCDMMKATQHWFICANNQSPWCIAPVLHCNGKDDCSDGSDEVGCSKTAPKAVHRSIKTMCVGCSDLDWQILRLHNKLRALDDATNMNELQWNPQVAARALAWAKKCQDPRFGESPHGMMSPDLGQNVGRSYWSGDFTAETFERVVNLWYWEKDGYDYATNKCRSSACGHYKAMASSYARELGCGVHHCTRHQNGMTVSFYNMVCDYRPWPNWKVWQMSPGQPYIKGAHCSQCQPGLSCRNNLCA